MGSNNSKSTENSSRLQNAEDDIAMAINRDPRSPTPEISRTPLHSNTGSKHNITKNVDLRKTFQEIKSDGENLTYNPILSAVIKSHLQSFDPRSPTQEFERTPIIIADKINQLGDHRKLLRIKNENIYGSPCLEDNTDLQNDNSNDINDTYANVMPKNLCNGFFDMTLNESHKDEPLGSSTASNEGIEKNISDAKENSKLLETNFDYIESENEKFEDSKEDPEEDRLDKMIEDKKYIPQFKLLKEDPRSPSTGIDRTPIVVEKITEECNEEFVEEISDTLIIALKTANAELRQNVLLQNDNMSEGILIYEDKSFDMNETPKKPKSAGTSGSRTPLSCMKNKTDPGHTRSKSANMLHDPKTKLVKRVSHIPRLKSLAMTNRASTGSTVSLKNISKSSVIGGDCENTPPNSHRDKWDKNNSIIL